MNKAQLYTLKDQLHELVKIVGAYQLENLGRRDLAIDSKSSTVDLVTEVDKHSEDMIIAFIDEHYPDHAVLAEESGLSTKESDYLWIIDPVDGTTNYAHGYPMFAISIGLQYKGDSLIGVIYMPYMDDLFWAIKGEGAYLNEKAIEVSHHSTLENSIVVTGFPYDKKTSKNNNLDYFGRIMPNVRGIRRSGSACVDLASVACGRVEAYFEMYLNPWDFIPGQLIIREAKGICEVKSLRGRYSIMASNPYMRQELKEHLLTVSDEDYPL